MSQHKAAAADQALHIFISTGEVSGDLQGSYLIQALHRQAQTLGLSLRVSGLGGPRMVTAGADLVGDTTPIGSVGILEALPYLLPNWKIQRRVQRFFQQEAIDLTIFLDYMGPNLGLGTFLLDRFPDLPTAYYIAPQQWVWAFSEKDTEQVVRIADQMVAVFPQEAEFYRDYGAKVSYFGHPLVDKLAQSPNRLAARQNLGLSETAPVITLLPASRQQEVKYVLPLLLAVAEKIQATQPNVEFLVPISMGKLRPAIETAIARSGVKARLLEGDSLSAIAAADLVLNKSGTANLEVALLNVPQVVVYRLNPITARIGYYLLRLRIEYVSPVNLFLNQAIVPEFIQWEATVEDVTATALKLLTDTAARQTMLDSYAELRAAMGKPGVCDRVAAHLLGFAHKEKHKRLGAANPRLLD